MKIVISRHHVKEEKDFQNIRNEEMDKEPSLEEAVEVETHLHLRNYGNKCGALQTI